MGILLRELGELRDREQRLGCGERHLEPGSEGAETEKQGTDALEPHHRAGWHGCPRAPPQGRLTHSLPPNEYLLSRPLAPRANPGTA